MLTRTSLLIQQLVDSGAVRVDLATGVITGLRGRPLKQRTREHYQAILDHRLLPTFGDLPIGSITAEDVKRWHAAEGADTPTATAHAYSLLSTVMASNALSSTTKMRRPCNGLSVIIQHFLSGPDNTLRLHLHLPY